MTLTPSASENSGVFERLHPQIQRWIWEQKWDDLRDVQSQAISAILDSDKDILISAATAAGKTEAAFLPVLTRIAGRSEAGLSVLYISPLKALINDQFRRLDLLCERMEINVVRWHGDAPQADKARMLRSPQGIALITPESIEALFVRRPTAARLLFGALDFVVIDEFHSFLQGPRGLHLASLLRRIDGVSVRRPRRVGLSATIGDLPMAAAWMNPSAIDNVLCIESSTESPELRLQIRGYVEPPDSEDADDLEADDGERKALDLITDHVFEVLRGNNNLLFAGSRRRVEAVADRLRRRSERANLPNEFFPHHGSLSKELREELELRLKQGDVPTTAVATTTLELGIDIGSVRSVAQIGGPRSLASLRQRLGRSGRRRGTPAVLRIYLREKHLSDDSDPLDRLRMEVVRSVGAIRLLVQRFVEPPGLNPSIATVVLHQTLSIVAERGGERIERLYKTICGGGPLSEIGKADYILLLRCMASTEARLIEQAPDGTVMLGEVGEQLTNGREFYAIFESDQEWRLTSGGRTLGTIPLSNIVGVGTLLGFAGRRWRVEAIDDRAKVLSVVPHRSGRIPKFDRLSIEPVHDRLVAEMRLVYQDTDTPTYLDVRARELLAEGRTAFQSLSLQRTRLIEASGDTHILTWRGTGFNAVFAAAMTSAGLACEVHDLGVTVTDATPAEVKGILERMASMEPLSSEDIGAFVGNLIAAKYDEFVPEILLRNLWARANAELCAEVPGVAKSLANSGDLRT
ncbi:MAG: DEAD/DEAH box helicase [Parvibaculum sp.]|uniref:DEAD/DEAH box helicase n=1 Tax=Parvibaculum sp. TaxID=2024848 RepID=UPI0032EFAC97